MEYKKIIIPVILAIFLFSITSVCASEMDTPIASEDTNQMELSDSDKVTEDNPQTSEEKLIGVDDEVLSEKTDTDVLADSPATYSELSDEINTPGNITLAHKSYTYNNDASAITISENNKVIDGNGAVIDMAGSTIRAFNVSASGVTIKNLTIKNAKYNGDGGVIYFSSSGTVTNCNFINNTATSEDSKGGAIFFDKNGTVTNCNFTDNAATYDGGAIWMNSGTVTNCNFTDNTAYEWGGAIRMKSGTVSNCNFADNTATIYGGAINMDSGNVSNCNFTNNTAQFGGAIDIGLCTVSNCNFISNNATNGSAIYFWNASASKTVSNSCFINNTAKQYGGAIFINGTVNVNNCNFTNNNANSDGAIAITKSGYANVTNCNFNNNTADNDGGAIYNYRGYANVIIVKNQSFKNNE